VELQPLTIFYNLYQTLIVIFHFLDLQVHKSLQTMYTNIQMITSNQILASKKIECECVPFEMDKYTLQNFNNLLITLEENKSNNLFRIMCNFNRTPIFSRDTNNHFLRFRKWLLGGHWSVILSSLIIDEERWVLLGDTNANFGNYLIPSKILFQGIQCRDWQGFPRGIIVVRFKQ